MKRIIKFSLLILIFFSLFIRASVADDNKSDKTQASMYKIVVFTDLDNANINVIVPEGQVTCAEYFYWRPIKYSLDYGKYVLKDNFSTFFTNNNILDFDIAVFPIGDKPLSYAQSGHSVIGEIYNMIEHGKRVIVIGHKALYHQYAGGTTDPQVDDFFKNVLKIQYLGRQSVSGEKSYVCYGTENDTISDWQVKWFNMHNWENGSSWMFVNDLDVFKITDKSKSFPVDCFNYGCQCEDSYHSGEDYTYYYNKGIVDSLVGMKCWAKTGKAVFFSNRFENGWQFESIPFLAQEILAAVRWCYLGLPAPEAALIFSVNEINFSGVPLGDSLTKDITVTNYGRTPLVVNDVFVDDLEVGAFILLTPGAFTLQPLQSKKLQVRFKPTEQRKYLDAITFLSNASNGGQISLDLKGVGGSAGGPGPILTVNAKLDFGSVRGGMVKVMGIDLRNTGSSELLAQKMELTDNDVGAFGFNKTADSKVPFYISPDSIHRINIKFMPKVTEPGKKYTAKLRIESNDVQGDIT
ncbi:MAG: choice-of-anchor D domain-containing protein, partial [Bacteroidota bacterium]